MDVLKGKHCFVDECKQFDFLPFSCDACQKTFCLDHRSQKAHKCRAQRPENSNVLPKCPICNKYVLIKSGESVDTKVLQHIDSGCTQYTIDRKKEKIAACAYSKCKATRAPCECKYCHKFFCPQHRLADDHICGKSGPKKNIRFNPFKAKLNTNKKASNKTNKKWKAVNPSKARIRMKTVAIGNKNIESKDRFYVEIQFSKTLKKKALTMFFNRKKTVGRILDEICDERNIKNKNHIASARQLVLVCVRTGGVLPCDVELKLMEPEFQSGDTILIRYDDE